LSVLNHPWILAGGKAENVPGGYHVYGLNNSFKFNWVTPLQVLGATWWEWYSRASAMSTPVRPAGIKFCAKFYYPIF
jgi:hypothetical protein